MSDAPDRVMLDLETLGLEPSCAIVSIGAVRFDVDGIGVDGPHFHRSISLGSCQDVGLTIDAATLEWGLDNLPAPRHQLTGGEDLAVVLDDFADWVGNADEIWANSPAFDCSILGAAYEAIGGPVPWEYYQERCHRTLTDATGVTAPEREGEQHNALDDAIHQARVASRALEVLEANDAE